MITYTAVSFLGNRSAEIAQLVEHFTRNEGVVGSSPVFGLHNKGSGKCLILCLVCINHQNKKNAYNLCGIPTIHDENHISRGF